MKKILFGVAALSLVVLAGCGGPEHSLEERTAFAQCLTDNNVTMYGTERCPHCKNQKAMFGEAFDYVDYIDCDQQKVQCDVAGIQGFPTRIMADGEKLAGTRPLEELAQVSGCPLITTEE